MAYATGEDMVKLYDIDLVGDLAQDTREPVNQPAVKSLPNLLHVLELATGEIDVALIAGGKYSPDQLAILTTSSKAHLVRVTCAIAMALLFERRPSQAFMEMAKMFQEKADRYLKYLRNGTNLFNIEENKAASTIELQTVTAVEIDSLNLLPTRMSSFFPGNNQRTARPY
jgi:phage gp36-like protein